MGGEGEYVGRGGAKLKWAIDRLGLNLRGTTAADFGCSAGGFTDCLLREGAVRVYAVDTGYGMLAWKLRQDQRVVAMERTNAMHVSLPERVDLVTVDVSWTRQRHILPNALRQLKLEGFVLSLFKPQYEAPPRLVHRGQIAPSAFEPVLAEVLRELEGQGVVVREVVRLPQGGRTRNPEAFLHVLGRECRLDAARDGREGQ